MYAFIKIFIFFFTNMYDVACVITPLDIKKKSCYHTFFTII